VRLSQLLRRVFSNPTRGISKSCFFLNVAFATTAPHSFASDAQSTAHAHRAVIIDSCFFVPSTGTRSQQLAESPAQPFRLAAFLDGGIASLCVPGRSTNNQGSLIKILVPETFSSMKNTYL
jgi:hypothetical protein